MPRAIPTSTDHAAGLARFRRTLLITVAVLAVLCAGLGAASILQGPKLQGWHLDTTAASSGPGQQLRLVLNEGIEPVHARQLTITPNVPAVIRTQGTVATIQLGAALHNATRYRVELSDVRSSRGGPASTIRLDLTTPALTMDYLRRGDPDRIMTITAGGTPRQVWAHAGIQSFTRVSGAIVVATTTPDRQSALTLVQPGKALSEQLTLPDQGRIDELTSIGNRVLFTLSSKTAVPIPRYYHNLFSIDLEGSHTAQPVAGVGGAPLAIDDWLAVPGTTALIVHGIDGSVVRYDPLATPAVTPLGSFQQLGGLSPFQNLLGVYDAGGPVTLDLVDGTTSRVAGPVIDGHSTYAEFSTPITAGRRIVMVSISPAKPGGLPTSELVQVTPTGVRKIFAPGGTAPMIIGYRLTANGQYLIVEVNPNELHYDPDDSPVNFAPRGVTTVVVRLSDREVVAQVAGFDAR